MASVALVGADGAGKSTIAREVVNRLPNATYLYMGVNLEASTVMLPTTRLALELKRRLGGRPDMSPPAERSGSGKRGVIARLRNEVRYANLIAEEWFRQLTAWYHARRGSMVVFDRHFVWDYHASFPRPGQPGAGGFRGLHDRLLQRRFPRPDVVICLDAPAEVLLARKEGGTVEERDARRREYLRHGSITDRFELVDVSNPPEQVVTDVLAAIAKHLDEETAQ